MTYLFLDGLRVYLHLSRAQLQFWQHDPCYAPSTILSLIPMQLSADFEFNMIATLQGGLPYNFMFLLQFKLLIKQAFVHRIIYLIARFVS